MTAPLSGGDTTRERLAKVLLDAGHSLRFGSNGYELDTLMTEVDALAAERAAEALDKVADELHILRFNGDANPQTRYPHGAEREVDSFYGGINRAYLHARVVAAALRASSRGETGQ